MWKAKLNEMSGACLSHCSPWRRGPIEVSSFTGLTLCFPCVRNQWHEAQLTPLSTYRILMTGNLMTPTYFQALLCHSRGLGGLRHVGASSASCPHHTYTHISCSLCPNGSSYVGAFVWKLQKNRNNPDSAYGWRSTQTGLSPWPVVFPPDQW